jgi:cellulose biosynthesis protein BcsQ
MKAVLEVVGPPGSGKTTLCSVLLQLIADRMTGSHGVLALDVSPDQGLTRSLTLESPDDTLAALTQRFAEKPSKTGEAIDWSFQDLIIPAEESVDVLPVGPLPRTLTPSLQKMLGYGFSRLAESYDLVLLDGEHPFFRGHLPADIYQVLVVMTPDHWDPAYLQELPGRARTPAVVMNQCQERLLSTRIGGELGAALDEALDAERIRLIGKLPQYPNNERLHQNLPAVFQDCLLRLDLPFSASSLS